MKQITLGTAQFSAGYGTLGGGDPLNPDSVDSLLSTALDEHIGTLDTAPSYGEAQAILGRSPLRKKFKIISKLGAVKSAAVQEKDISGLKEEFEKTLFDLQVDRIHGLLFHSTEDLLKPGGEKLVQAALQLKEKGFVSKVGVSVYFPRVLESVFSLFKPDLVQLPLNVLDQRFASSGLLKVCAEAGAEIQARSVFLQGLLLAPKDKNFLAPRFPAEFSKVFEFLSTAGRDPVAALLAYPFSFSEVGSVVVGALNEGQLKEIASSARRASAIQFPWRTLASENEKILLPYLWEQPLS